MSNPSDDKPVARRRGRLMPRIATATGLLLAGLAIAACGRDGDGEKATTENGVAKIRVTVTNATEPYVIPWLVAREQGLFREQGVDVTQIIAGKGGSTTLRNLISGDLAVGEIGLPAVVEAKVAGTPVKVVGGAVRSSYAVDFYALADGPVKKLADAKTWAFTNKGSVTEALTYLIPQTAGIDRDAVDRVAAGGVGEGIALLESGEVDVAVVPPSVVAKNPEAFRLIASSAKYLPGFQQSVMTVTDTYAAENPNVIKGVLAAYQEAVASMKRQPDAAAALYAEHVGVDQKQARTVVDAGLELDNWSVGFTAADLDNAVKAMRAAGQDEDVPWCELFELGNLPSGAPRELPVTCAS